VFRCVFVICAELTGSRRSGQVTLEISCSYPAAQPSTTPLSNNMQAGLAHTSFWICSQMNYCWRWVVLFLPSFCCNKSSPRLAGKAAWPPVAFWHIHAHPRPSLTTPLTPARVYDSAAEDTISRQASSG